MVVLQFQKKKDFSLFYIYIYTHIHTIFVQLSVQ